MDDKEKALALLERWWFGRQTDETFYSEMRALLGNPIVFKRESDKEKVNG